jgi:hypothetical protein
VKRHAAAILVIAAGLAAPALTAVPASAGNGTSSVGCSTGDSCTVMLEKMIQVTGDQIGPNGTLNTVVNITPPPCLWEPIGDAVTGSNYITSPKQFGSDPKTATTQYQVNQSVAQADALLKQKPPPAGEWYMLPVNPAAGPAGWAQCIQLPLFVWVPPGQSPPGMNIPPQTLAQLAIARVRIPGAGTILTNPARKSFTNLPTFVRATLNGGHPGPGGRPYVSVTAALNGTSVTVWAEASRLQISASGGSSYTADTSNCGYLGSNWMVTRPQQIANTGPGGPIDCGLTFQTPATWHVTASMTWQTCWAQNVPQNQVPDPATCTPVPGAQLNGTNWPPQPVIVNEIQSVNNGAG